MASLGDFTKPYDWTDEYGPVWLQRETACGCSNQKPVRDFNGTFSLLRCESCGGLVTHDRSNRKEPGSYDTDSRV